MGLPRCQLVDLWLCPEVEYVGDGDIFMKNAPEFPNGTLSSMQSPLWGYVIHYRIFFFSSLSLLEFPTPGGARINTLWSVQHASLFTPYCTIICSGPPPLQDTAITDQLACIDTKLGQRPWHSLNDPYPPWPFVLPYGVMWSKCLLFFSSFLPSMHYHKRLPSAVFRQLSQTRGAFSPD